MMIVASKDGGTLVTGLILCDGCNNIPEGQHQCAGEIGSECSSRFPTRTCQCHHCKDESTEEQVWSQ